MVFVKDVEHKCCKSTWVAKWKELFIYFGKTLKENEMKSVVVISFQNKAEHIKMSTAIYT